MITKGTALKNNITGEITPVIFNQSEYDFQNDRVYNVLCVVVNGEQVDMAEVVALKSYSVTTNQADIFKAEMIHCKYSYKLINNELEVAVKNDDHEGCNYLHEEHRKIENWECDLMERIENAGVYQEIYC